MPGGHCQCGAIRFEFSGEPSDVSFCHCSICRKLSGSAFAPYIEVAASDLRISGDPALARRYAVTERLTKIFCGTCGTPLFTEHSAFPGLAYICIGALDSTEGIVPEYHQFVASKARWYEIRDGLPQYDGWPESDTRSPGNA